MTGGLAAAACAWSSVSMSAIWALSAGFCMGGMPTQITVAPPLSASAMNWATRCAYIGFHWGEV